VTFSWLVLSRAVHFVACLLVVATLALDRLIVAPTGSAADVRWQGIARWLLLVALALALLSGVSWLGAIAADMSGLPPAQALHPAILQLVWTKTHFGRLWQLRSILWACATILVIARCIRLLKTAATWMALACAAALSSSLAWAGHGLVGNPQGWHLLTDGTHLLIAGFWPAGLLPFGLLLGRLLREPTPQNLQSISALTYRFSAMSLASVALLAASGLGNSWFLVGSFARLWQTAYGRVLLAKVAVFIVMIGIGAINLLRLKSRASSRAVAARLRWNVGAEAMLAAAVIVLVAILGLLQPACH
jgi:putative copper resistance protein D